MNIFRGLLVLLSTFALPSIGRSEDFSVKALRFTDPNHPQMLAWKFECTLPTDAGKPRLELDYDFWDRKVEGDAYSIKRLNIVSLDQPQPTASFVVLLSAQQSLVLLSGRESRGSGASFLSAKPFHISDNPKLDSGTGGFILAFKTQQNRSPDQVSSYFDLESWVLLTITFHSE